MSSHILSDIEALCDNVAILKNGKLTAQGNLQDLLTESGETQTFEINVKGVSAEVLENEISGIAGVTVSAKPNGANIQVLNENDIEKILEINKKTGGNLVSIQPVKQSLEKLFVKETVN